VPLRTGGDAGTPQIAAQANLLRTADGIAFDAHGNLYVTVNTNRLVRLASDGALTELAAKNNGLVYPTMPAFGTTPATRTTLYITNGARRGIATVRTWRLCRSWSATGWR
jgi:sugar lactone lactonase YvrE